MNRQPEGQADSTSPAALGYRMPAEWEPHAATWMSWPRRDGISFPDAYDLVAPVMAQIVTAIAESEVVCLTVRDRDMEEDVRALLGSAASRVRFLHIPTNEPWCRDHGPCFLTRVGDSGPAIVNWGYNAWGGKYPPFDLDNGVPVKVAELLGLICFEPDMILEGGSIDVNGQGALLTTESCLLNPNRNPNLDRGAIERHLREYLGVNCILWLGDGIVGDDTDGHVDDLTRFVAPDTVITMVEPDSADPNHQPLEENRRRLSTLRLGEDRPLRVIEIPMPAPIVRDGQRLPASYANFYIANTLVLLPVFNDPRDAAAIDALATAFPTRRIIPIPATDLVWGLGAVHCLTQQQPTEQA